MSLRHLGFGSPSLSGKHSDQYLGLFISSRDFLDATYPSCRNEVKDKI